MWIFKTLTWWMNVRTKCRSISVAVRFSLSILRLEVPGQYWPMQTRMETRYRTRLVTLWTGRKHYELALAAIDNIMASGYEGLEIASAGLAPTQVITNHLLMFTPHWNRHKHSRAHWLTNLVAGTGCYLRARHWTPQVWVYHTGPYKAFKKNTLEKVIWVGLSRSPAQAAGLYCMPPQPYIMHGLSIPRQIHNNSKRRCFWRRGL